MPSAEEDTTPSEVLTAVRDYFLNLDADRQEFRDWLGGTVNGGPNNDGQYPLTDFTNNTYLVDCPAKIAATVALTMGDLVSQGYEDFATLDASPGSPGQLGAVEGDGIYWYHPVNLEWEKLADFPLQVDPDVTFAADSDERVPTQKAVKAAIDASVLSKWTMKGGIDCSADPNFPAALRGDAYVVTLTGRIGGVLGEYVRPGDLLVARNDNAGGNLVTATPDWFMVKNDPSKTAATLAEIFLGAETVVGMTAKNINDMLIPIPVAYAANVTLDHEAGINFEIAALTGNIVLENIDNPKVGRFGTISLVQDGVGGHTITYGDDWVFPNGGNGAIDTSIGGQSLIFYTVQNDGTIFAYVYGAAGSSPYYVPFGFTSTPTDDEILLIHVFPEAITLSDDLAGAFGSIGVNPDAEVILTLKNEGVAFGTITISDVGAVTYATTGAEEAFAAGEALTVHAPAAADGTIANCAFILKGLRS